MDQIILLQADGALGKKMAVSVYEDFKTAIVEVFLFTPKASLEEITKSVSKKLSISFEGDIDAHIKLILPDLIGHDYIEQLSGTESTLYQLKFIVC